MSDSSGPAHSDGMLGALVWMNKHQSDAERLGILLNDLETAEDINRFCLLTGSSQGELEADGRRARQRGCSIHYSQKRLQTSSGNTYLLYRTYNGSWGELDGTVESTREDEQQRELKGSAWHTNSCAVDCVIVVAIYLKAWRTRIDQLKPTSLRELALPCRLLRQIAMSMWGSLPQENRDGLRNILRDGLESENPTLFPRGELISVGHVLDHCLKGLPQTNWTEAVLMACCDGTKYVESDRSQLKYSLEFIYGAPEPGQTLSTVLSDRMTHSIVRRASQKSPCERQDQCTKTITRWFNVVLDRMPPVLMIHIGNPVAQALANDWEIFSDLNVSYLRMGRDDNLLYTPICAIFVVSNTHFIVRTKVQDPGGSSNLFRHHDAVSKTLVREWWSDLTWVGPHAAKVMVVFYRLVLEK